MVKETGIDVSNDYYLALTKGSSILCFEIVWNWGEYIKHHSAPLKCMKLEGRSGIVMVSNVWLSRAGTGRDQHQDPVKISVGTVS